MKVAYADPPYIGVAARYKDHPDYAGEVDHVALIARMVAEYPDGWALSCHTPSLRVLLPLCPEGTRVLSWCKPYVPFKPSVKVAYSWEPVIVCGGRKRGRGEEPVRDWWIGSSVMHNGHQRAFLGQKPEGFCFWLFAVLNLRPGDDLVDMFPGSGAVTRAWVKWQQQLFTDRPRVTTLRLEPSA